jgi:hypothetical protein
MMTTTAAEGLARRLQELADRADLADLLARQGRWLDEQRFDGAASIFTEDATIRTQSGQSQGLQALTAQARRIHASFAATQHVTSGVLIDIDGDRATMRANLIATFVRDAAAPEPGGPATCPGKTKGRLAALMDRDKVALCAAIRDRPEAGELATDVLAEASGRKLADAGGWSRSG